MVDSLEATSNTGPVVQVAGNVQGDINLRTGAPVRNRYRYQVARIAPSELIGREPELAELARFCTACEFAGQYRWLQAAPWSGKTALLSWFVSHPPPGARLVTFFVTARLAGQADRSAFMDNLLEQLVVFLDGGRMPHMSESTRESHLLAMLDEAAEVCARRGEALTLLVDGLDEDRDAGAHSIAALLPTELRHGMRVVVASRPDPGLPADVPPHHPLASPAVLRALRPSAAAQAVRTDMERELGRLLAGSLLEQDILGLVTASGGGLATNDLVALTGATPWEVERCLASTSGRTFTRRPAPGGTDTVLLGHEELAASASMMLGPARLAALRDRVHAWADAHRLLGWGEDTPEYLLRGYFALLADTGDLARMTSLCLDTGRTLRLATDTMDYSAALAQVAATRAAHARAAEPDLVTLARLCAIHEHLAHRTGSFPPQLPVAWAWLGRLDRARDTAAALPAAADRAQALAGIAEAALHAGDLVLAEDLAARAEQVGAAEMFEPGALVRVLAALGAHDRARAVLGPRLHIFPWLIEHVARPEARDALAAADAGDVPGLLLAARELLVLGDERAGALVDRADAAVTGKTRWYGHVAALHVRAGRRDRAVELVQRVLLLRADGEMGVLAAATPGLVDAVVELDEPAWHERLLAFVSGTPISFRVERLFAAWVAGGAVERAYEHANTAPSPPERAHRLAVLAVELARRGMSTQALQAVRAAWSCTYLGEPRRFAHYAMPTLAFTGPSAVLGELPAIELDRAVSAVRAALAAGRDPASGLPIAPLERGRAVQQVVRRLCVRGEVELAARLALAEEDESHRRWALDELVLGLVLRGDLDAAERVVGLPAEVWSPVNARVSLARACLRAAVEPTAEPVALRRRAARSVAEVLGRWGIRPVARELAALAPLAPQAVDEQAETWDRMTRA
ncbi:hypothetical protein ACOBQX_21230 [Actinokineospora sp. G85]|uniref:hypothetical protein n=1 Tax=Actinokineospora sp. G85 TaxID=3406626 RepID=UPI003C723C9B